jgi:predicted nuclease with TOPRIM domain
MPQSKRNRQVKNSCNHEYEILKLLRENKRLTHKLKDQQSILTLNEQSDDVKQYVQLREQYKNIVNEYGLDLSPNDYIIEQIKRFKSEKEDLKSKYETLRDEYDSLIEQHSLLKIENEELTTRCKDLQAYFNILKNSQKEIK